MYTKIFIRTFPSDEECELFESLLKTRWPTLLEGVDDVSFKPFKKYVAEKYSNGSLVFSR